MPSENTQVIVSTHSTHISSAAKISNVNILANKENYAEVYQPSNKLSRKKIQRVERYLDAVRSTLLFAKGVMLVEGDAEQIIIPSLIKSVFGVTPDELGFSIVSMDSAFFENIAIIFDKDRIQRPCAILTDSDEAYVELPSDPATDTKEEKHIRDSQTAGNLRKDKLLKFTSGNDWVELFFSDHTFEVDFVKNDNSYEVIEVLGEIYKNKANIQRSSAKLKSENISEYGKEVLRLAKKEGKGWFALLLSGYLTPETYIPKYIIQAIAFSARLNLNFEILAKIADFRLQKERGEDGLLDGPFSTITPLDESTAEEFIQEYRNNAPEDSFSILCDYFDEYKEV